MHGEGNASAVHKLMACSAKMINTKVNKAVKISTNPPAQSIYPVTDSTFKQVKKRTRNLGGLVRKPVSKKRQVVDQAKAITKAIYLEQEMHGAHTQTWPVAWTSSSSCFAFFPPSGSQVLVKCDVTCHTEYLKTDKDSGMALLQDMWEEVLHLGKAPVKPQVGPNTPTELPMRLTIGNFQFHEPLNTVNQPREKVIP